VVWFKFRVRTITGQYMVGSKLSLSEFVFSHLIYCCMSSLLVDLFTCLLDPTTCDYVGHHMSGNGISKSPKLLYLHSVHILIHRYIH